jgi:ribosome-binding factor A
VYKKDRTEVEVIQERQRRRISEAVKSVLNEFLAIPPPDSRLPATGSRSWLFTSCNMSIDLRYADLYYEVYDTTGRLTKVRVGELTASLFQAMHFY